MHGAQSYLKRAVLLLGAIMPTIGIAIGLADFVGSPYSSGLLNTIGNALFLAYLYGAVPLTAMTLVHGSVMDRSAVIRAWPRRVLSVVIAALSGLVFLAAWLLILGTGAAVLYLIPWLVLTTGTYAMVVELRVARPVPSKPEV